MVVVSSAALTADASLSARRKPAPADGLPSTALLRLLEVGELVDQLLDSAAGFGRKLESAAGTCKGLDSRGFGCGPARTSWSHG